ncbi:hypothetical protein [Amycolatopsis speibonae]|uniref:Uncharacterized protein n=1 Tax=Amycolatopsis speibonae TaxID=1450224 RepID=A0ABV7P8F6_9PSEU
MTVRQTFKMPALVRRDSPSVFVDNPEAQAEHDAITHPEPEFCHQNCDGPETDHPVTWRIHPRPDPGPVVADGVITELVSCCTCCAWSCGTEGFVARLQRESYDGRDIRIERLANGVWTKLRGEVLMGIIRKIKEASKTVERIVQEEAPRPKPEPKKADGEKGGGK